MRIDIISIGNSKGIRIPKALLEQLGQPKEVDLLMKDGSILITPSHSPRDGWEDMSKAVAAAGGDKLIIPDTMVNEFDTSGEWEW